MLWHLVSCWGMSSRRVRRKEGFAGLALYAGFGLAPGGSSNTGTSLPVILQAASGESAGFGFPGRSLNTYWGLLS